MSRLLIFASWLLLNGSLAAGQLLIAALLALVLPALARQRGVDSLPAPRSPSLRLRQRLRCGALALRLLLVVLFDILRSSLTVAGQVLGPEAALRPAFVRVPLALRSARARVVLASIVTLTPGTVSAELGAEHLLVHALHVDDSAALVAGIQQRYETPLRRIFEP